jgi:hypothetical protein
MEEREACPPRRQSAIEESLADGSGSHEQMGTSGNYTTLFKTLYAQNYLIHRQGFSRLTTPGDQNQTGLFLSSCPLPMVQVVLGI